MTDSRWRRLVVIPWLVGGLACGSRETALAPVAPPDSVPTGPLRIELPAFHGTIGGPAYATIRRCEIVCDGPDVVVAMHDTVATQWLEAGTYVVRIDPPMAYEIAGDTAARTMRVTMLGGASRALRFAVRFRPLFDESAWSGPLALVPASHVRLLVVGLDEHAVSGGRLTGGSELGPLSAQVIPRAGIADVRLGWGHWMDFYFWLTYEPPSGYRVIGPSVSTREIWFSTPVERAIWPIAVERVP